MFIALLCITLISLTALIVVGVKLRRINKRFAQVLSLDDEAARITKEMTEGKAAADADVAEAKAKADHLSNSYDEAKKTYDRLKTEVLALQDVTETMSFGLYKPQYAFETSEAYKQELESVYVKKKECIKSDDAVSYPTDWTVNGSIVEGRRMTKKQVKIMLRAFNGECDAAVARVTWNNATRMTERINRSFQAINETGLVVRVSITKKYLDLCLRELHLAHEYELKKQEEKESAREARERMREEERAQKDFERAQREAAIEKAKLEKALAAAHDALQKASGEHLEAIQQEIETLEERMAAAQSKQDRAVSMAQLTRMGHVYVISNIGSFGDNIFKIGMTRRLEPSDRIQELSGASVPFGFDVHAMIFSEDAPSLETALHTKFSDRRLNLVNPRKEYFQVSLGEISEFVSKRDLKIEFLQTPEARHFRESQALRLKAQQAGVQPQVASEIFPEKLFSDEDDDQPA